MPSILLQYDSLKTVLRYMNANLRIHLSQRLPSIKLTEKAVPLQIDYLDYGRDYITINGTKYEISVHRNYHAPMDCQDTVDFDLDASGFPMDFDNTVEEGDIKWAKTPERLVSFEEFESDSNLLMEGAQREIYFCISILSSAQPDKKMRNILQKSIEVSHERIEKLKRNLLPYKWIKENQAPKYTLSLQLTVSQGDQKVIYHRPYNMRIHEGLRLLYTVLFGGRIDTIQVKKLKLFTSLLRFPENRFKLKIKSLLRGDLEERNYEELEAIIMDLWE